MLTVLSFVGLSNEEAFSIVVFKMSVMKIGRTQIFQQQCTATIEKPTNHDTCPFLDIVEFDVKG